MTQSKYISLRIREEQEEHTPREQANIRVSDTIHLGAGTAIWAGCSLQTNKTIPRTGRDLGHSWRVHPVVQKEPKNDGFMLQLGLDAIPGTSTPASLVQQPLWP